VTTLSAKGRNHPATVGHEPERPDGVDRVSSLLLLKTTSCSPAFAAWTCYLSRV